MLEIIRWGGNQKAWMSGLSSAATTAVAVVVAVRTGEPMPPAEQIGNAVIFALSTGSFVVSYATTWLKANRR